MKSRTLMRSSQMLLLCLPFLLRNEMKTMSFVLHPANSNIPPLAKSSSHRTSQSSLHIRVAPLHSHNNNDGIRMARVRKRDILFRLILPLAIFTNAPLPSNAVMGTKPTGLGTFRDKGEKSSSEERVTPPAELLEKLEQDGSREANLELKMYAKEAAKRKNAAVSKEESLNSLRPVRPTQSTTPSPTDEDDTDIPAPPISNEKQMAQLSLLKELLPEDTAPASSTTHKILSVSEQTDKKLKTQKNKKIISIAQMTTFIVTGIVWSRSVSRKEQERVQKGLEIYQAQKNEFFNVTNTGESDEELAQKLRDLKAKNKKDGEDEDEDDDDDEEDVEPKSRRAGRKPKFPPPSPSSSGDGLSDDDDDDRPSDEDIERLKNTFKL